MSTNELAKGFYWDKPRGGSPEFIVGRISVKTEQAIETLKSFTNDNGYVTLELLQKKDGSGHYLQVNTYGLKPQPVERPDQPDESWREEQAKPAENTPF